MSVNLNVRNFITNFVVHPLSPKLTKKDRKRALCCSIAIGILSVGLFHAAVAIGRFIHRKIKSISKQNRSSAMNKVHRVASKVVANESPAIKESEKVSAGRTPVFQSETSKQVRKTLPSDPFPRLINLGNSITLQHCHGNILKSNADYIVNAANKNLRHGGGICGIIHGAEKDGGISMERENKQYLGGKNEVQVGDVTITRFDPKEELKCNAKYVLHTPGPDCRISTEKEQKEHYIRKCYRNCLNAVANQTCYVNGTVVDITKNLYLEDSVTVAFPVISGGIFQYPSKESIGEVLDEIQKFAKETKNKRPRITVQLVTFGNEDRKVYYEAFLALEKQLRDERL